MKAQSYERFAERLLKDRQSSGLPPFCRQALLTAQAKTLDRALGWLRRAQEAAESLGFDDVFVYEPVPMPLMRLMDKERGQLLVEADSRARLHAFLSAWVSVLTQPDPRGAGTEWAIEVDPASI